MQPNERQQERRHAPRILVVENDEDYRLMLKHRLLPVAKGRGWEVLFLNGFLEAEVALRNAPVDLVVSDYHLGDGLGTALTRLAHKNDANPHRIILSSDPRGVESAWRDEPDLVDEVWAKGWDPQQVVAKIETRMDALFGPHEGAPAGPRQTS